MPMFVAELETWKWSFRAFGHSEREALENMKVLYEDQAYNHGLEADGYEGWSDAVVTYEAKIGKDFVW